MSLLSRLFGRRSVSVAGEGDFNFEIVGESFHQDNLGRICGGKTDESREHYCAATIRPEKNNPHDENAVAIFIDGLQVGHLARQDALAWRELLIAEKLGTAAVSCDAVIVGGWDRGNRGRGSFGVKLDLPEDIVFSRR